MIDEPTPMNEFDLLQIVAQLERDTGLSLAPDHPGLVQDERGAWWHPSVTEDEREEMMTMLRDVCDAAENDENPTD